MENRKNLLMAKKTKMTKFLGNLIKEGGLCYINNDLFMEHDMPRNTIVIVMGSRALPLEEDPYTQRVKFAVAGVDLETGAIDYSKGLLILDPKSLRKVTAKVQKDWDGLQNKLADEFNAKREADSAASN